MVLMLFDIIENRSLVGNSGYFPEDESNVSLRIEETNGFFFFLW